MTYCYYIDITRLYTIFRQEKTIKIEYFNQFKYLRVSCYHKNTTK